MTALQDTTAIQLRYYGAYSLPASIANLQYGVWCPGFCIFEGGLQIIRTIERRSTNSNNWNTNTNRLVTQLSGHLSGFCACPSVRPFPHYLSPSSSFHYPMGEISFVERRWITTRESRRYCGSPDPRRNLTATSTTAVLASFSTKITAQSQELD